MDRRPTRTDTVNGGDLAVIYRETDAGYRAVLVSALTDYLSGVVSGVDGKSLLNGTVPPGVLDGTEGDFWIDTASWDIYGPKAGTDWGLPTTLVGPQGDPGVALVTSVNSYIGAVVLSTPDIADTAAKRYTSDAEKATWNAKQNALGFTPVPDTRTVAGKALSSDVTLDKTDVGLGNVDNTSDANKPVSTAQAIAIVAKENSLGVPTVDGYVLSSTTGGVRSWVAQSGGGGGGIPEAPEDGTTYGRKDAGWVAVGASPTGQKFTFVLHVGENATVGTNKTNILPVPAVTTIDRVTAIAKVAPVGSSLIFDINVNGTSIWDTTSANRIAIPSGSTAVAAQTVFDTTALAVDDRLTIDIDQIGSSTPGQEITVTVWAL